MAFEHRIDHAKEKMRHAEDALESYILSGAQNFEEYCELVEAVRLTRVQFIDQLTRLCPKDPTTSDAFLSSSDAPVGG